MNSNTNFTLLVVDDDPLIHQSLKLILPNHWKMFSVQNPEHIHVDRFYHAAFVDMHLGPGTSRPVGPQVISKLLAKNPQLEVVAMSGDLSRELMENCLKVGAQKFLAKPLMTEEISLVLEKIEALWHLRNFDQQQKKTHWIGQGSRSQEIKKRLASLKGEKSPVLIEGETGTGKEVVARLLNQQEGERPFVAVNLGSIPEHLFESEIFGHIKGAFTGADQNKMGLAEAAHGGDLFLDEIEALPLSQQVKLLRFLESGEIRKVGAKESQIVQVRVIAASNRPLKEMIAAKEFREDLYFRLSSQCIELPPLRERLEDIQQLAEHFLSQEKPRRNKVFSPDGLAALQNYTWPGNVRELKRVCEQLSLTSPLPMIRADDVKNWVKADATMSSQSEFKTVDLSLGLAALVEQYEAHVIATCLKQFPEIEDAAKTLKISRSNLYKKISDYKIGANS